MMTLVGQQLVILLYQNITKSENTYYKIRKGKKQKKFISVEVDVSPDFNSPFENTFQ